MRATAKITSRRQARGLSSPLVLCALCVGLGPLTAGCMPDIVKMYEVQARQQNSLITSVTDKVNWDNVAAVLASKLNNPRLTVSCMYSQGVVIDIVTNGVESSVSVNAMGAGAAPNDSATAQRIELILQSKLPPTTKEQLIADLLKELLVPPSESEGAAGADGPGGEPGAAAVTAPGDGTPPAPEAAPDAHEENTRYDADPPSP